MPTSKRVLKPARKRVATNATGSGRRNSQTDPAVTAFLRDLHHPLKREFEAVRQIILGVSPEISEGIKWNAPSFRTTEYFATFFLETALDSPRLRRYQ